MQNDMYFAIAVGRRSEALKDVRLKIGEGIAGWVAKHGETPIVPDVIAIHDWPARLTMRPKADALGHLHSIARKTPRAGRDSTD